MNETKVQRMTASVRSTMKNDIEIQRSDGLMRPWGYVAGVLFYSCAICALDVVTSGHFLLAPFYLPGFLLLAAHLSPSAGIWWVLLINCIWFGGSVYGGAHAASWPTSIVDFMGHLAASQTVFLLAESWHRHKLHAHFDPLTGIVNRRGLEHYARREIARCQRLGIPLTVGYIDCDDFKRINDRWGHKSGDALLRLVATTLATYVRPFDLVSRVGGDEFVVMLSGAGQEEAAATFEKLRERLELVVQKEGWPATFSVGVATFSEVHEFLETMVEEADHQMYAVKKSGKVGLRYHHV